MDEARVLAAARALAEREAKIEALRQEKDAADAEYRAAAERRHKTDRAWDEAMKSRSSDIDLYDAILGRSPIEAQSPAGP